MAGKNPVAAYPVKNTNNVLRLAKKNTPIASISVDLSKSLWLSYGLGTAGAISTDWSWGSKALCALSGWQTSIILAGYIDPSGAMSGIFRAGVEVHLICDPSEGPLLTIKWTCKSKLEMHVITECSKHVPWI